VAIHFEERFVVRAPARNVWATLVDPRRVVGCVPGGELEEVIDDRNFRGRVRESFGAVTVSYRGRVRLAEVDATAHRVKIVGEARQGAGAGSARLALHGSLAPPPAARRRWWRGSRPTCPAGSSSSSRG
jgi:carbon monoxide dehydrogenase subunit G